MGALDNAKTWIVNWLGIEQQTPRDKELKRLDEYYEGEHKEQLKVKPAAFNDNISANFCGLIVNKAVSALVGDPADGHGLSWTFPSELDGVKDAPIEWLDTVWDENNKEIFLHMNALAGAKYGYPAVKIVTDGVGGIELVNIKTKLLKVETDPQNAAKIIKYVIQYIQEEDNKQVQIREVTEPSGDGWSISTYRKVGAQKEVLDGTPVFWPYPFPPILSWQNLPDDDSPYGQSDIESIIPLQDRYNFVMSNISKIIRLYAHPQRFGKNLTQQIIEDYMAMGPDEMLLLEGDGEIVQLPNDANLDGSLQFANMLRELIFSIGREVDVSVFKDKVGAVTNMGLKLMYKDALEKLGTKRMLYGNAYQELNRRLLILGGYSPEICQINWPSPLLEDEVLEVASLKADMELGIVSKQTIAEIRGYDWEDEQERIGNEKMASDNAGGIILDRFFNSGR